MSNKQHIIKQADKHEHQSKQESRSKKKDVHSLRRGSAPYLRFSGKGRHTESYKITDLREGGDLKMVKSNKSHGLQLPSINNNILKCPWDSKFPQLDVKPIRQEKKVTGHQHISSKQRTVDLGTKVPNPPSNEKYRERNTFSYNTYQAHVGSRHRGEKAQEMNTNSYSYNMYKVRVDSRHRAEKAQLYSNGMLAACNDKMKVSSPIPQQDKIIPHRGITAKQTFYENEQAIYSTGESTGQSREPPNGLPNIGNTCYANSLFQVLGQTPFLNEKIFSCVNHTLKDFDRHMKTTVTNAFRNLLRVMNFGTFEPISAAETIAALMNKVSHREREFRIGFQNDCHSFFLALLSEIYGENQAKEATRIFEIEMVDNFNFDSCVHKDETDTQIMRSLTIPSESHNVEKGLEALLNEEEFDEAEVPCRKCGPGKRKTRKTMQFHILPKALVIQLGCFQENRYRGHLHIAKSIRRIGFSERLRVPKSNGSSIIYHLYGVVNHHGSVHGGHYTSFVKHLSPNTEHWYYCNDSNIEKSTLLEALESRDAYLLFYKI